RKRHHDGCELQPQACQANYSDDHACDTARNTDHHGVTSAKLEPPPYRFKALYRTGTQRLAHTASLLATMPRIPQTFKACDEENAEDGVKTNAHGRIARCKEGNQEAQWQQVIPTAQHGGTQLRQVFGGHALHVALQRNN